MPHVGQEVVRRRATANLALALALEGALGEARRVLDPVIADGRGLAEWTSADAGVEWLTDGFLSYWTNDLERAQRSLRIAADCTDDPQSFAALARVFGVFTAVARDEPDALAAAEEALRAVAEGPGLGVAWHVYQRVARAMLDLDAGRREQAGAAVRDADDLTGTPLCAALAAEVLRRCGDPGGALERLAVLPADLPSYVAVSALLTRALAEHGDGAPRRPAHRAGARPRGGRARGGGAALRRPGPAPARGAGRSPCLGHPARGVPRGLRGPGGALTGVARARDRRDP